jgi:phospholipid/cholesterol/gamma-HCH transport system substrate-binding protein
MLDRKTRTQLLAFVTIALLGIAYVSTRYVGIQRWFGAGYTVKVRLASGGGIFPNADVTYRGVSVGRVGDMRLHGTGIEIDLDIDSGLHIPSNVDAVVADGSVIGEQFVDLRPRTDRGPYLGDGDTIPRSRTKLPPPVQKLLVSTDELAGSIPVGALQTVVNELYLATNNSAQDVGTLIDSMKEFFGTASDSLPQTIDLIDASKVVLRTQHRTSAEIRQFSRNLVAIAEQLHASGGDITTVLRRAAPALGQANRLIQDVSTPLHGLLTNLLSTSQIVLANKDGLRELFVNLPVAITDVGAVITPNGINTGLVPTFFDPLPCVAGYEGTLRRSGLQTDGDPGLNTFAQCTAATSSGTDLHGSQHAP